MLNSPPAEGVRREHYPASELPWTGSPVQRDLEWLALTPDLVKLPPPIPHGGRPTLHELGLEHHLTAWLSALTPASLAAVNHQQATRMGHYHERLWHLLLDTAPNTRLLAKNVRIYHKRITLGELDMVYRTRDNPAPVHLEVAIKFYLGLPEGHGPANSLERWIGPGGLDSLALKCAHLRRHQLPLSTAPLALATLAYWLTPRDTMPYSLNVGESLTHRVAMPGVLFYPWHTPFPAPQGATPDHRRGLWCFLRDWPALVDSLVDCSMHSSSMESLDTPIRMAWLRKPHWLAPPRVEDFEPIAAVMPGVERLIEQYGPQQVMLYMPHQQRLERVFIVPNSWPRQVPLPSRMQ